MMNNEGSGRSVIAPTIFCGRCSVALAIPSPGGRVAPKGSGEEFGRVTY